VRRQKVVEELHIQLVVLDDQHGALAEARVGTSAIDVRTGFLVSHVLKTVCPFGLVCAPILGESRVTV
jgi:hypothetical protein